MNKVSTVVSRDPRGIGSRTPMNTKIHDAQVPYIKQCRTMQTVIPSHPWIPNLPGWFNLWMRTQGDGKQTVYLLKNISESS